LSQPLFLTLAEVIEIHKNQIELYGGSAGVRDFHLLQSALAQPEASFAGEWLHRDLFEMAAAYTYHLSQNHSFFDGNKRTALAAALVFLEINGESVFDPNRRLHKNMLDIAAGHLDKKDFTEILRQLPRK